MRKVVSFFLCFIAFIPTFQVLSNNSYSAHPGNTDANGCHVCRTNCTERWGLEYGEYHCHNGGDASAGNSGGSASREYSGANGVSDSGSEVGSGRKAEEEAKKEQEEKARKKEEEAEKEKQREKAEKEAKNPEIKVKENKIEKLDTSFDVEKIMLPEIEELFELSVSDVNDGELDVIMSPEKIKIQPGEQKLTIKVVNEANHHESTKDLILDIKHENSAPVIEGSKEIVISREEESSLDKLSQHPGFSAYDEEDGQIDLTGENLEIDRKNKVIKIKVTDSGGLETEKLVSYRLRTMKDSVAEFVITVIMLAGIGYLIHRIWKKRQTKK